MTTSNKAVNSFKPATLAAAVKYKSSSDSLMAARATFFNSVKMVDKVTMANLANYKGAFALCYLQCLPAEVQKVLGDNTLKGSEPVNTLTGNGKTTDKRGWAATVRDGGSRWMQEYENFLRPVITTKNEKKTTKTNAARDIVAVYPRLAAYRKLDTPTTSELEMIKFFRVIVDAAVAHCPQAKEEWAALERKATKLIK
jgi:hypothetical protein